MSMRPTRTLEREAPDWQSTCRGYGFEEGKVAELSVMTESSKESILNRPLPPRALRWSVPVLYGLCAACVLAMLWEDYRRVNLAEEVARIVKEERPATMGDLESALSDHLRECLLSGPSRKDASHSYRAFQLSPRVWLTLSAEYETESGRLVDVWMIYGGSEPVSLGAPRDALPEVCVLEPLVILAIAGVCSGLWLWWARRNSAWHWTASLLVGFLALLPLPLVGLMALIGVMRIMM